jgi:hypothetical protein
MYRLAQDPSATGASSGDVVVSYAVPAEGSGLLSFSDGGYIMYPLVFCALMVLVLAARTAWRLRSADSAMGALARSSIDAVLFWGGYALVLGVLGTAIGIATAAQAVELVGAVHPTLVWGGIRVSLISTLYGLIILSTACLLWFVLRQWHRRLVLSDTRAV